MSSRCRNLLAIFVMLEALAVGCAEQHTVPIPPTVQSPPPVSSKGPADVAVVFADGTKTHRYHGRPITLNGTLHSYDFDIGPALSKALLRGVNTAYQRTVEVPKVPRAGEYPFVIVFTLQSTHIDLSFEDNPFKPSARASSALAVRLELLNGKTMTVVRSFTANGRAFVIRALEQVSSRDAEQVFATGIESSIQQLSDKAADMLTQWAAEKTPQL